MSCPPTTYTVKDTCNNEYVVYIGPDSGVVAPPAADSRAAAAGGGGGVGYIDGGAAAAAAASRAAAVAAAPADTFGGVDVGPHPPVDSVTIPDHLKQLMVNLETGYKKDQNLADYSNNTVSILSGIIQNKSLWSNEKKRIDGYIAGVKSLDHQKQGLTLHVWKNIQNTLMGEKNTAKSTIESAKTEIVKNNEDISRLRTSNESTAHQAIGKIKINNKVIENEIVNQNTILQKLDKDLNIVNEIIKQLEPIVSKTNANPKKLFGLRGGYRSTRKHRQMKRHTQKYRR